jgi:hypothetical protein
VEAPQGDQLADRRIEQPPRAFREPARLLDESRDLRRGGNVLLTAGDGFVERHQLAGLPRVQIAMHTVEFAKHAGGRVLRAPEVRV